MKFMKKLTLALVFLVLINAIGVFGVSAELTAPTVYDGTIEATFTTLTGEKVLPVILVKKVMT